jgi:hypothetical protein
MSVPLDGNGRPLARVSASVSEKIGLPNYSNVDVGPIVIERWCEDTPEARQRTLTECTDEAELVAGQQRTIFLQRLGHKK